MMISSFDEKNRSTLRGRGRVDTPRRKGKPPVSVAFRWRAFRYREACVAEPRFISNRDEILASARREIAHHGLEGATLRGVARHAGGDPNLIRHYFGSKATLFRQDPDVGLAPAQLTAAALRGGTQQAGRRALALLLRYWENPRTGP